MWLPRMLRHAPIMPNDFVRGFLTEIHHGSDFFSRFGFGFGTNFLSKMDVLKLHREGGNQLGTWVVKVPRG